jgi:hypothetical protein
MTRLQNVAIIVALLISVGTLYLVLSTLDIFDFSPNDGDELATEFDIVAIERRDLSEYKDVNGILEYGDTYQVGPSESGVLTYVASQGSELDRGSVVFRVYKSISKAEILSSDQQIASANASVAQAEIALENLNEPASAVQIASANASVAQAELALENLNEPASAAQIASANASVAQAEIALENLNEPASAAQIASANASVAQAEIALENLNEPASAAQIASSDAAVSDGQLNSVTSESGVDLAEVSLRIARKSFCDRAYDIDTPSWVHEDPICPDSDVILQNSAVKTLLANMFTSTDDLLVTRSNSLLNAHQNYVSAVGFSESVERNLFIAVINRAALDELPTEKQIVQATESLKSAREQRAALDELPTEKQIVQATESLKSAREQRAALDELPTEKQIVQATESLKSAREQRAVLDELPTGKELVQLNSSLDSAKASLSIALSAKDELIEGLFATVLMFGDIPAWRGFQEGMSPGEDVNQLEENLLALGYASSDSFLVDNNFDTDTVEAIQTMQDELGLVVEGEIDLGEVVFFPGKSVVEASSSFPSIGTYVTTDSVAVSLTPIERTQMEIGPLGKVSTRTESLQRVSTSLEVSSQDLIEVGSEVNIELPDESVVKGRVIDIGNVAVIPQGGQSGDPYLEVSVAMEGDLSLPEWTGATVTVSITKKLVENILSVPVISLLALLDGGYAVEVLESGSITRLVPVETGIYADGWVEVTGQGLEAGIEVVMPK